MWVDVGGCVWEEEGKKKGEARTRQHRYTGDMICALYDVGRTTRSRHEEVASDVGEESQCGWRGDEREE